MNTNIQLPAKPEDYSPQEWKHLLDCISDHLQYTLKTKGSKSPDYWKVSKLFNDAFDLSNLYQIPA